MAAYFSHLAHASANELERRIMEKFNTFTVKADPHDGRANISEERYAEFMNAKL